MKHDLAERELECLRTIQQLADELRIPIVALGANARRLVFDLPQGIEPHRSTQDWDFGVRVPTWAVFAQLRTAILGTGEFRQGAAEHRLLHVATGMKIDLVPFGGLETDGRIEWPASNMKMSVMGFSEAYAWGVEVELETGLRLKVATAPLLVALKIIAFADRRDETDRDLTDLWHFMKNYAHGDQGGRIWEEPFITHLEDDFELKFAGSFLLGYDVACACSPATIQKLLPVIAELEDPYSRYAGPLIGRHFSQEEEEAKRQEVSKNFQALRKGTELAAR